MENKPIAKFSAGTVSAAVFSNKVEKDGKNFVYHTISLQKRYTDKDGKWKTANSYRVGDLPKVKLCLDQAYKYLLLKGGETSRIDVEQTIPSPVVEKSNVIGVDVEEVR